MVDVYPMDNNLDRLLAAFPDVDQKVLKKHSTTKLSEPLSPKALKTLQLLVTGLSDKETAEKALVSLNTIKTHIKKIYEKINVNSRAQAINKTRELDLIEG